MRSVLAKNLSPRELTFSLLKDFAAFRLSAEGEFVFTNANPSVLIQGPSGSGKTGFARWVAGHRSADRGFIRWEGETWEDEKSFRTPERRGLGIVPQGQALFPHLTVQENIGYGLRRLGDAGKERVSELLTICELQDLRDRLPRTLSGGQKQRVAIARSLAPRPPLLLWDEPFSALDPEGKARLLPRLEIVREATGAALILISHDVTDGEVFRPVKYSFRDGRLSKN